MKKILLFALVVLMTMSFVACKKETSQPLVPGDGKAQTGTAPHQGIDPATASQGAPVDRQIVVPDDVKGKWDSIVLTIADKATNTSKDVTVMLGESYTIEGSTVTVKAVVFLPDFAMEGAIITSRSAELNSPAAKIIVTEDNEEIFSSWVFSNMPSVHPFPHEKYGITLKGGKKSG